MPPSIQRGDVRLVRIAVCLGVALGFAGVRQTVRSASVLVSHWKLDEGQGTTTTDSASKGTGTLRNGAAWTTGRLGAAVNLDGVDDYISLPSLEVTGSAITLTAWIRNSGSPTESLQRVVSKAVDATERGTYWFLGLGRTSTGANRLRFRLRVGETTTTLVASSGDLPLNTWYHAAATYDGRTMRLYLNGTEVGSTAKSGFVARGRNVPVHIGRSPEGSNYLRGAIDDVRIHSSALTRTEIAALVAAGTPANQPPSVSWNSPANGATFLAGANITLSVTASDPDGTIARVEFFEGSKLLGSDTSSPYSFTRTLVEARAYTFTAIAYDNAGASTTSDTRTVTASTPVPTPEPVPPPAPPPNQPPSVSLTSPAAGTIFTAPASITLDATASDVDGTITRVDFYAGTTLLGSDATSPYSYSWTNVAAGSYALTAVARDNVGATTVSSTRDITVKPPNLPSTAVFVPSSNHATAVDRYVLEIFPAAADPTVANPVATLDLGKPAITNGECKADIASVILALPAGTYIATVTAVGNGGSAQSAPSPQFTR